MNNKFCGICLNRPVKLYSINVFNLREYYVGIMSQEVICALPRYFCYTCAALLYKFHKFKDKCCTAQKVILELMQQGPLTLTAISQLDRKEKKLAHSLDIMTESERVKTFCLVDNTPELEIKIEPPENIKIENKDIESDGDDAIEIDKPYENISNVIEEEKINSDEENMEYDDENINFESDKINTASQSVLNDHTYLRNEEQPSDINRKTVQVPHIVKTSADSANLRVLVVGDIKNVTTNDKLKSETKTQNLVIRRHSLPKKVSQSVSNYDQKIKLKLNPKHWEIIRMTEEQAIAEFQSRATKPKYLKAQYKCDKCYTAFSSKMIMNKHMKLIHAEERGPHECPFCHRHYRMNCLLRQHMAVHYTKFKCLRCSLEFNMEMAVQNHDELHSGKMRKCLHCDMEFRHKSSYYSHLRIYHRSEHVCKICGASFVSQKGLQQHDNLIHRNSDNNVEEVNNENTYCEKCDIKFVTLKGYKEHFNESVKHADKQIYIKGDVTSKGNVTSGAPLKGGAIKSFEQNVNKITTCIVCEKLFPSYSKYVAHHKKEHKDVPITDGIQLCEICGRSYKSSTIAFHMNIHTREKSYPCTTCGAQFYHITSLTRHQMIHTGERPHKCPLCEKRFTQKVSMQIHHRTVHLKEPYPKRAKRKKLVMTTV